MKLIDKISAQRQGLSVYDKYYGELVYPKLTGELSNRMKFKGHEVITWSFNDYLGFQNNAEVKKIESDIVSQYGAGYPAGSRLLSGNSVMHEELEYDLSLMVGKPTQIINLGYPGIISIIQSLVDRRDTVIYDQEVHACLIDGARLQDGERKSFKHNDIIHLEEQLKKTISSRPEGGILVLVDGVYSMRGSSSKLHEIIALKNKYDFTLLVDDSHGFLVYGQYGSVGEELMPYVDVYISTFAKALASVGGFVAADQVFIDHFKYNLRSQVFGRTLPLVNVVSVSHKLFLFKNEGNKLLEQLWANKEDLQSGLKNMGFDIGDTDGPITPVYLECPEEVSANLINSLRYEFGIFCSCVTYPVIPKGRFILRLIVTAIHTEQDIAATLVAFANIKKQLMILNL